MTRSYDSLLLATDGSDGATVAADHALALAGTFDATLHVLGVVPPYEGPDDAETREHVQSTRHRRAEAFVETIANRARGRGVDVVSEVDAGVVHQTILDYADNQQVDLVVIGSHGQSGVTETLFGSTAARVVTGASMPVLVGSGPRVKHPEYDTILLPTDGSTGADAAIPYVQTLATAFDATVHVLYVVDVTVFDPDAAVDLVGSFERLGSRVTAEVGSRFERASIETETAVRRGRPTRAILDYAAEVDAGLVAMGTHGASGLEATLLGSTTERILRAAERPVLTVHARPATVS